MTKYRKARRMIIRTGSVLGIILVGGALGYGAARYGSGRIHTTGRVPPPVPACSAIAGALSTDEKIGQLMLVGVSNGVAAADDLAFIKGYSVGGVVYLGNNDGGAQAVASLSAQLQSAAKTPLLIAADQEGGNVQRLTGPGFDTIPSASMQAQLAAADLQSEWQRWGGQLRAGGINYNLAPVTDFVAPDFVNKNAPIGMLGRNYGTDEQTVERSVRAALRGMRQANVLTAAKHFPGLGAVVQNTDYGTADDNSTMADSVAVRVFERAAQDGADSVMVSLATYANIDPHNQATFSKAIISDLLRGKLKWQGVIVSDDLGAAAAVGAVPAADRGVRFLAAGGDLIIAADRISAMNILDGIKARASADAEFARALTVHATRVLAMKSRVGLIATCQ